MSKNIKSYYMSIYVLFCNCVVRPELNCEFIEEGARSMKRFEGDEIIRSQQSSVNNCDSVYKTLKINFAFWVRN